MSDGLFYAVRFENGKYYTALGYRPSQNQESFSVEDAALYRFDCQVPKDIYLKQYIFGKDRRYNLVKVEIKTLYEVSEVLN